MIENFRTFCDIDAGMNRKFIIIVVAALLLLAPICVHRWIQSEREYEKWNSPSGFGANDSDVSGDADSLKKAASGAKMRPRVSEGQVGSIEEDEEDESGEWTVAGKRTQTSSGPAVAVALSATKIRVRTSPEFDIPGVINKDFKPGHWLEISSKAVADKSVPNGRFSVRLELQMADGSLIRSDVESDIYKDEVRLYLSPLSFRRLTEKKSPSGRDVVWFALTDRISGRRVTYGNPFQKPPKDIPPHKTIRPLTIEETPFFYQDKKKEGTGEVDSRL